MKKLGIMRLRSVFCLALFLMSLAGVGYSESRNAEEYSRLKLLASSELALKTPTPTPTTTSTPTQSPTPLGQLLYFDCESGFGSYERGDQRALACMSDYWGCWTNQHHTGNSSAWCAYSGGSGGYGIQCAPPNQYNYVEKKYDHSMTSYMKFPFNVSTVWDAEIEFWIWRKFAADDSCVVKLTWNTGECVLATYSNSDAHWRQFKFNMFEACPDIVGTSEVQLEFWFTSDEANIEEGVYIDDISVRERPTLTPTLTRTVTPTQTQTPTYTPTRTQTSTYTLSPTRTSTVTSTPTRSPTYTPTGTPTCSPTSTSTLTPTVSPTKTPTLTLTRTPTGTFTPTVTSTPTDSSTPTRTMTKTPTMTPTSTATRTPTLTPTVSPSPTITYTSTVSSTPTRTPSPTPTNTLTPTRTFTPTLTETPSANCEIHILPEAICPDDMVQLWYEVNHQMVYNWEADVYVVLEVAGLYFWWPEWTEVVTFERRTIDSMTYTEHIFSDLKWPHGVGSLDGLSFYVALLRPDSINVICYNQATFEYDECIVRITLPGNPGTTDCCIDTGIQLDGHTRLEIHATGEICYHVNVCESTKVSPDGTECIETECNQQPYGRFENHGAVIGKVGAQGTYFLIGSNYESPHDEPAGTLYLCINDGDCADNGGSFKVEIITYR